AIFNALAVLLLAGAIGAAVNLVHRLAQEQRREIGIGMALGVRPAILAVRPLLVSAQIALLGVVFGIGIGTLIGNAMGGVFRDLIPLPIWDTSFQYPLFFRVATAGVVLPFLASIFPVWRAVRVPPIDAIKPAHLATGTWARAGGRRSSRGRTLTVMPIRNLRRSPRRTILTILGIAAAITVLAGFLGIMDSVFDAIDKAESEARGTAAERITVGLDSFYPIASEPVAAVGNAESVAIIEPTLRLPASVRTAGSDADVDLVIGAADLTGGMWRPTITAGELAGGRGLILSEKAAADLGVGVGDVVILRHPLRTGL
ncbi:MAG: FtsX-like permease family protein, partial [Actinobacteria bacterium]|nr:FtsX-like permease family protein [Actinomycetota bacterium]NIU71167.1 FtsX-like permease family protein [Actinomycetota bacterium]NIV90632.1 FtsX-like permease family protein [Actinomycetota bacterium]NIW33124.1 FtsX-like permease family protein [Actinomycetota bacterium]